MTAQHQISRLEATLPSKPIMDDQTESVKVENVGASQDDLTYSGDVEPELHLQTWIAVAAMFMLNFVQVFALTGPPAVVSDNCRILVHLHQPDNS